MSEKVPLGNENNLPNPRFTRKIIQTPIIDEYGDVIKDDETGAIITKDEEILEELNLHSIPSTMLNHEEKEYLRKQATPLKKRMSTLRDKINRDLGDRWWRKYINCAFWSNISTPINLAITLLTTLTTGQATTDNLLNNNDFVKISIATLVLSTLNTFFRPHQQLTENTDAMNKWRELGTMFEMIYYAECYNDLDYENRIKEYEELQKRIHHEEISQETKYKNYLTDLIYLIATETCLKRTHWIQEENNADNNSNNGSRGNKYGIFGNIYSRYIPPKINTAIQTEPDKFPPIPQTPPSSHTFPRIMENETSSRRSLPTIIENIPSTPSHTIINMNSVKPNNIETLSRESLYKTSSLSFNDILNSSQSLTQIPTQSQIQNPLKYKRVLQNQNLKQKLNQHLKQKIYQNQVNSNQQLETPSSSNDIFYDIQNNQFQNTDTLNSPENKTIQETEIL